MTISTESKITINGEKFFEAKEIGFTDDGVFIISLYTTPEPTPRGSYFTTIPISAASYRERRNTKTSVTDKGDHIAIYDDWGKPTKIGADRGALDSLLQECKANNVPLNAPS